MTFTFLKKFLRQFRDDKRGTILVETVITLPLLVWALAATFEFFEVHRYKSIRDKATYTIADMISRESRIPGYIDSNYINNSFSLFNNIVNDSGVNQLRITIIAFVGDDDSYAVRWSEVRGTGTMSPMTDEDAEGDANRLPIMNPGDELILVEAQSKYTPTFSIGMSSNIPIASRTFTSIRFLPKICWNVTCNS